MLEELLAVIDSVEETAPFIAAIMVAPFAT